MHSQQNARSSPYDVETMSASLIDKVLRDKRKLDRYVQFPGAGGKDVTDDENCANSVNSNLCGPIVCATALGKASWLAQVGLALSSNSQKTTCTTTRKQGRASCCCVRTIIALTLIFLMSALGIVFVAAPFNVPCSKCIPDSLTVTIDGTIAKAAQVDDTVVVGRLPLMIRNVNVQSIKIRNGIRAVHAMSRAEIAVHEDTECQRGAAIGNTGVTIHQPRSMFGFDQHGYFGSWSGFRCPQIGTYSGSGSDGSHYNFMLSLIDDDPLLHHCHNASFDKHGVAFQTVHGNDSDFAWSSCKHDASINICAAHRMFSMDDHYCADYMCSMNVQPYADDQHTSCLQVSKCNRTGSIVDLHRISQLLLFVSRHDHPMADQHNTSIDDCISRDMLPVAAVGRLSDVNDVKDDDDDYFIVAHNDYNGSPRTQNTSQQSTRTSLVASSWSVLVVSLVIASSVELPDRGVVANSRNSSQALNILVPAQRRLQNSIASSWTSNAVSSLKTIIANSGSSITIDLNFQTEVATSDPQIKFSSKAITINGNGAVLDAGQNGRFFFVRRASLTLYSITLQNGKSVSIYGFCFTYHGVCLIFVALLYHALISLGYFLYFLDFSDMLFFLHGKFFKRNFDCRRCVPHVHSFLYASQLR